MKIIYFRYEPIRLSLNFYTKYESKMAKARREVIPRIPNTLSELGDVLYEYPPTKHIFVGKVVGRRNSEALLFIHPDMFDALQQCKHLQGDGTFDVSKDSCLVIEYLSNYKIIINTLSRYGHNNLTPRRYIFCTRGKWMRWVERSIYIWIHLNKKKIKQFLSTTELRYSICVYELQNRRRVWRYMG